MVPASQGRIAGYRIGEDQSGGNGTILQHVGCWRERPFAGRATEQLHNLGLDDGVDHGIFFRCQTAPLKYSYMLGGMFSSCASAMCLRTVSEYWKRSPQMRQCHCSRAKMYGRHSGSFGSSLEWGIFKSC